MEILIESVVRKEHENQRLDAYLASRFDYKSRTLWRREISDGSLLYNGEPITNHHKRIKEGDTVRFIGDSYVEPEVDRNYSILYEDDHIIAVNKPGNIPVHPAGIFFNNTLQSILENDRSEKLHPLHRLDRETSGVILFGRQRHSSSILQTGFSSVKKKYITIVNGMPAEQEFTVDLPLGSAEGSVLRKKRAAYAGAPESALTRFRRISTHGAFSLLMALPETGRQHQIRAHLQSAGHPIAGDKMYGVDENMFLLFLEKGNCSEIEKCLGMKRCALHSYSINFTHPVTEKNMTVTAPMPSDFKEFLARSEGGVDSI
jgi:23S rRNA pseudouridine955/2504/2580 synthase